jgi:predicted transglutaminase-like cysteine proteinase
LFRPKSLLAAALAAALLTHPAGAGTTMQTGDKAFAPPAFKSFCARQKALCSTSGRTKVMDLTASRRAQLQKVNASINRRIKQKSDLNTSGKTDSWDVARDSGDCEDIAIRKKSELMKLGWPASTLLLTVARLGSEGHTVLTVRTSDGDLVLDNRTSTIRDWSRTPYRYFARQSQSRGSSWERVGRARKL